MTGLEPNRSSSSPPSTAPTAATTLRAHAEQQHVGLRDAVHVDAEHRAEGEHAGQPVAEDRAGEQVVDDVAVAAPFADDLRPTACGRRRRSRPCGARRPPGAAVRSWSSSGSANSANQAAVSSIAARTFWPSATGMPQQPAGVAVAGDEPEVDHQQQHHAAEIARAKPNPEIRPDVCGVDS